MKNILFVVHSLRRGGAENQLKQLISTINCSTQYEANLLVFTNKIFFDIKEFKGLTKFQIINPLRRPLKFIRCCGQYDYVISFMFNASIVTTALLLFRKEIRHFLSIRVERMPLKYYLFWKLLCKAKSQIFNSHIAKEKFISKGLSIESRSYLLNNILTVPNEVDVIKGKSAISVIAHWRPQKDHATALRAIAKLDEIGRKVSFYGELLDLSKNHELINRLQAENKIELHGVKSNLQDVYAKSEIVILPTFYEGTPNVVLEGLANRCKILTSDIDINKYLAEKYSDIFLYKSGNLNSFLENFKNCISSDFVGGNDLKLYEDHHKDSVLKQLKCILDDRLGV